MRLTIWLLFIALLPEVQSRAWSAHPNTVTADEQMLKEAQVATDGPGLLEFFRKRTLMPEARKRIEMLLRQLGDNSFKVRSKASAELVAEGVIAIPFLRQAMRDKDLEVVYRAEECIRLIEEKEPRFGLPAAAARLVAVRKPAGALEVLLEYAPYADDETVSEEVLGALAALAASDGKPEKTLLAALSDRQPQRRAVAVEVLCRAGLAARSPEVRRLLKDSDSQVRLRAALALAAAHERDALPVLIDLLTELSQTGAWQAEDLLLRVAGEQAPLIDLGHDEAARRQCRDAWLAWWRDHGAQADLTRLDAASRPFGYTLLVLLDEGKVLELDHEDKPRLEISGLKLPLDAQMLPGDRVLIAEHAGDRVTERNRKGEILWEKKVREPLMAQRLRNGNTFIATQQRLLEVDREGRETYSYARPTGELFMKAVKLTNGEIACVTQLRRFLRLDAAGKELQSLPANVTTFGGRIDVLPSNHILVPERAHNRVVEYDAEGRIVWQIFFREPVAAVRLPNGHTLVTSYSQNRAVEVDKDGKEVWDYKMETRVTRAFRR
jgi:HEAT repeats/PQQ-like domain